MSDTYKYKDSDHTYIDPASGLLRNLLSITDPDVLVFVESAAVTKRLQELYSNPIKIDGIESLFEIHKLLFQDVYDWAGEKRKVEISKEGKQFFPTTSFDQACIYLDALVLEYRSIPKNNILLNAKKLAEILDNINYMHPFREGNGRAQREFLRLLALEKGFTLKLNPADNSDIYDRYMKGTISSDIELLTELILELITKIYDMPLDQRP